MAERLDATFYAFRKREGGVLLPLALLYCVILIVMWGSYAYVFRDELGVLAGVYAQLIQAAAEGGAPDLSNFHFPPNGLASIGVLIPLVVVGYMLQAAFEAGCLRWILRGERAGFMGLAFNEDTWRVWGIYWIWFGLRTAYNIASSLVIFAIVSFAGGQSSTTGELTDSILTIVQQVVILLVAVRLAPAAAATVARKQFSFWQAWDVTRGRFWAMFGAFALLALLACIMALILVGGAAGVLYGAQLQQLIQAIETSNGAQITSILLAPFQTPAGIATAIAVTVVNSLATVWFYVAFFGVNARATLAAAEEGKIDGVVSPGLASTFE